MVLCCLSGKAGSAAGRWCGRRECGEEEERKRSCACSREQEGQLDGEDDCAGEMLCIIVHLLDGMLNCVQKRAYLTSLHGADLVNLLMHSLELHPDLPIFPSADATPNGTPRSFFASRSTDGLFTRAESTPNGQLNYVRKASGKGKGSPANSHRTSGHGYVGARDSRENSPLRQAWPKPGMGLYNRLPPEMSDTSMLVDENDFESFSVVVYDEHGRKVSENGKNV
jgi:hypothetical protein